MTEQMSVKKEKEPHFISPRLLKALGGTKEETVVGPLVARNAYLWGVEDRDRGAGLFKHVMLVSRVAYALIKALKEKAPEIYGAIDSQKVVEGAILHDVSKLYAEERELLSPDQKQAIGVRVDFKEIDEETENIGVAWLKELGFSKEVLEGIKDHFPEKIIDNPYWKIILISDFLAGRQVVPLEERFLSVKTRWIDQQIAQGKEPRIDPAHLERAQQVIRDVSKEIFSLLGTTDVEFIKQHKLNDPASATRWERFFSQTREKKKEGLAERLVEKFIGDAR